MKSYQHLAQSWLISILALTLIACGGGDSSSGTNGGGGTGSVQYTGNTSPAAIDESNARTLANSNFTAGSATGPISPTFIEQQGVNNQGSFVINKLNKQMDIISNTVKTSPRLLGNTPTVAQTINETFACGPTPADGTVTFSGVVDDVTFIGNLTVTYNNCSDGFIVVNGSLGYTISAYNASIDELTDITLSINNLSFVSVNPADGINWNIGATMRYQLFYNGTFNPYTKRSTVNLAIVDNISGESFKYENFVTEVTYNQYSAPSSRTETYNGRVYHHIHGYVDVTTVAPLVYTNLFQVYPDSGGPLIYTGAANRKIKLTPVSNALVNLAADLDGDDFYEYSITLPWSSLDNNENNLNAPIANAGADQVINLGQTAQLDASQSTDADYNLLTFSWVVITQPVGSNPGLTGASSVNPTLAPDMTGSYTLRVDASDSLFTSSDTVTITVQ